MRSNAGVAGLGERRSEYTQHRPAETTLYQLVAQYLETFLAEAREAQASRVAKAELAAVDADLLRSLSEFDSRRIKLSLTFVGDHAYVECEGQSFDGPLTRATP